MYFIFLQIEAISLYMNEGGFSFAFKHSFLVSLTYGDTILLFGVFVSMILFAAHWLNKKLVLKKLLKLSLILSLVFGSTIFVLANTIAPEFRTSSYINRYESVINEKFSSTKRKEKINDLRTNKINMMSIESIHKFSDSIRQNLESQDSIISKLALKLPDSILEKNLSEEQLLKYGLPHHFNEFEYHRSDIHKLNSAIRKLEISEKKLRQSDWEINKRFIVAFLALFLIYFGIIIGSYFKNQHVISLICIAIVLYSLIVSCVSTMADYFIDQKNLFGLVFKLILIFGVLLYLVYGMVFYRNKDTDRN